MTGISRVFAATATVALLAGAGAANAQMFGGGGEWYVKGFGGATWPSGETSDVTQGGGVIGEVDLDYDTGYTLGAAVGYDYTPNFGLELEYAYRTADLGSDITGGDVSSNAFMMNALYKFNAIGANANITPYLGGGLGGTNLDIATDEFGSFQKDTLFAYQLIGGVEYAVNPSWSVLGEVRWFATDSGNVEGDDGVEIDTSFETFDLLVGATYNF